MARVRAMARSPRIMGGSLERQESERTGPGRKGVWGYWSYFFAAAAVAALGADEGAAGADAGFAGVPDVSGGAVTRVISSTLVMPSMALRSAACWMVGSPRLRSST